MFLPLPLPGLSQQLSRQRSGRAISEEAGVEDVKAAIIKLEESKVEMDPGHALESQVKERNFFLHVVKKTPLQAKPR